LPSDGCLLSTLVALEPRLYRPAGVAGQQQAPASRYLYLYSIHPKGSRFFVRSAIVP
jgi:hypothetical protein